MFFGFFLVVVLFCFSLLCLWFFSLNKWSNCLCDALELHFCLKFTTLLFHLLVEKILKQYLCNSESFKQKFTTADCTLILNPDLQPQFICITWIPSQVQDSTYSSFTFIDLSHPSANQPVKNLILHSFKPTPLKDSLELIGSLSLKRTQGNLMAEIKTASE